MLFDVLMRLEPLQRRAVDLVYGEGRSPSAAARSLGVERIVITAALAAAYRHIARWAIEDDPADDAVVRWPL